MAAPESAAQPPPDGSGHSTVRIVLPARVTVADVRDLRERLLACRGAQEIVLDGSLVEEFDTAGLQLLLAARLSAAAAGRRLEWQPLPAALLSAAAALDLVRALGIGSGS